ncbi:MAG: TetR/AcrR family transcriptional regulator [Myxococcales bacterium]|nr:TetR/AcrR family transcriptional regulator [Myxococcales bacterium]
MARPPEPEKRLALAREAVAVLQRDGVDVPIAQLADALGVKRPTLLYHFPSRSQIVECALEELLVEQWHFVTARIERVAHPIDRLYAQVRAIHEFHGMHEDREARLVFLTQALAATAGARITEIVERAAQVFESTRRANAERIRQGIRDGIVVPCDADAIVQLVRAITDGLVLQRVTERTDLAPVHDALWRHVLSPLKITTNRGPSECD